jgi:SNF2 family DNA or RNA helicase
VSLYQHQRDGADWLASRTRAVLGDVPGLGKTRTLLEAARRHGQGAFVVCPAVVRSHWAREAEVMGVTAEVVSYNAVVNSPGKYRPGLRTVLLDECHYMKSTTSKRTRFLLGRNGLAKHAVRTYLASGTPVPKSPADYWTILASCFPEVCAKHGLRTQAAFIDRFCRGYWDGFMFRVTAGIKNPEEFKEILAATMLRRTLDDVGMDVPEIQWQVQTIETDAGMADIEAAEGFVDVDHLQGVDEHVMRLRRLLGEAKAPMIAAQLADELSGSTEQIAVFAHHRSVLDILERQFRSDAVRIDGTSNEKFRDWAVSAFANGSCRVFLGQTIACGTGMDGLQRSSATRMVMVEPDWSAYVNQQLARRLARMGSKQKRVVVQMVALAGTLDEAIVARNQREAAATADIGLEDR